MKTIIYWSLCMLEVVYSSSISDIQTLFVQEQWELLLIMLLLVNIGWDSFLRKISAIYVVTTLSKQGIILCMSVEGIMSIEVQGETWLAILFFFWSLIVGYLLSKVPSYSLHIVWLYDYFSVSLLSFVSLFFSFSFSSIM